MLRDFNTEITYTKDKSIFAIDPDPEDSSFYYLDHVYDALFEDERYFGMDRMGNAPVTEEVGK